MKITYYVYSHVRPDTGSVFYIGIGTDRDGTFIRSRERFKGDRNEEWFRVFKECGGKIIIKILHKYDNRLDSLDKEMDLISFHGRSCVSKKGTLVNITQGGQNPERPRMKVIQYDLKGRPIKIWDDMYLAAQKFKITFKSISQALNKNTSSAGYQWRRHNEQTKRLDYISEYIPMKRIHQFDKKGNYLHTWKNMTEASVALNIDRGSINNSALGKRYSAGDFLWSFTDKVSVASQYRKITQYDLNMNFVKEYDSLAQIMRELNLPSSTAIRNCFIGKQQKAYGFKWSDFKYK